MKQGCLGRWGLQDKQPVLEASFEGHNDWINDIIVLEDVLVSCSSDTTIKLWKADQSGRYLDACTACDRHLLGNGNSFRPHNFTRQQVSLRFTQLRQAALHMQADCPKHLAITCLSILITKALLSCKDLLPCLQ